MKKRTGVILLVSGILCIIGAVVAIAVGIMGFVDKLDPIVTVESPGKAEFEIDAPGTTPLWHDFSNWHGGTFHHYDQRPPHGFTFELTHLDTGRTIPFTPLGGSTTQTMSAGRRESFGLGSFELPAPGKYALSASNPGGDQRFFSLTEGSFMSTLGSFGASFGIAALCGISGLALLIGGFIGILAGRKQRAATPPPPPPPPLS